MTSHASRGYEKYLCSPCDLLENIRVAGEERVDLVFGLGLGNTALSQAAELEGGQDGELIRYCTCLTQTVTPRHTSLTTKVSWEILDVAV